MLRILDRHLVFSFFKSYAICLLALLSLFIIVDLFTNLDEFNQANQGKGLQTLLIHVGSYYGQSSFKIFDRLCEAISLLAGVFTISWMQRNNELLPLLSAGVSTRRVVLPVIIGAVFSVTLSVVNQEIILPRLDSYLIEVKGNPRGDKETDARGAFDARGVHLSGKTALRKELLIKDFTCVITPKIGGGGVVTIQAAEARYFPSVEGEALSGGWLLSEATPAELPDWRKENVLKNTSRGKYFLYSDVDFDRLTRTKNWFAFLPTWALLEQMSRPGNSQLANLAVVFHMRLTRPILGIVLVLLGLAIILKDQNRHVFVSAGLCLAICAIFFATIISCQYMGDHEILSPAFAAWLPVIGFGPFAFVLFDAVHT